MGIPIGRLADKYNRRTIIVWGIAIWSCMTAVCGITKGYWQLFAARVGVGVGEAALSPAAYSMIADLFPAQKLGRALSVYTTGAFVGAGLAFSIGGTAIAAITTSLPEAPDSGRNWNPYAGSTRKQKAKSSPSEKCSPMFALGGAFSARTSSVSLCSAWSSTALPPGHRLF